MQGKVAKFDIAKEEDDARAAAYELQNRQAGRGDKGDINLTWHPGYNGETDAAIGWMLSHGANRYGITIRQIGNDKPLATGPRPISNAEFRELKTRNMNRRSEWKPLRSYDESPRYGSVTDFEDEPYVDIWGGK